MNKEHKKIVNILIKDLKNCDYDEQYLYNMLMKYKMSCVEKMVDVEENIISLCCNCHKQIHLGQGYEDMLKEIYTARKRLLKKVGIDISLENLILYYKMESK